jgi:hypothetical protein
MFLDPSQLLAQACLSLSVVRVAALDSAESRTKPATSSPESSDSTKPSHSIVASIPIRNDAGRTDLVPVVCETLRNGGGLCLH